MVDTALEFLHKKIAEIDDRTKSIRSPRPTSAGEEIERKEPMCPLAKRIRNISDEIDKAAAYLNRILEELEI